MILIIDRPITSSDIMDDCMTLGIRSGMTLLVHSSMKSIGGWIVGGSEAVILALENALGDEGTLIMPTQSPNLTDPQTWMNPPVDSQWWELIRESMPPYDPDFTVTTGMGIVAETFRKQSGVVRSAHPHTSFAARGTLATYLMNPHPLDYSLGECSPLARMVEMDTYVLLLGTSYACNTSFHLAEYRSSYRGKKLIQSAAPVAIHSPSHTQSQWVPYVDINFHSDDFHRIGLDFERDCTGQYTRGKIGQSSCVLAKQRDLIDYAVQWLDNHR
ncbi:AAC(3) family N-acetyltransferase [Paenibacillus sp. CMAA1364]